VARQLPSTPETGVVDSLTHDGEGVVHNGKAAFVPGALPGETVVYLRRKRFSGHDEAELREIIVASPLRVPPPCPHFALCGGCALQHLSPASQVDTKFQQLRDNLLRVGKVEPVQWLEPITAPVWNYRRRARLGARYVHKRERSLVGFRERQGSFIAAIDSCEVLAEPANRLIAPLSELFTSLSIRERVPQVELAVAENVTVLVLRVLLPPSPEDLAAMRAFETRHAVRLYLQSGGLNTVQPLTPPAPLLEYTLPQFDVRLQFLPTDFVQVNAAINRLLVGRVIDLLELDAGSRVLDLFCGLGNFSLPLARRAAGVVAVEGDAGLVDRARANAQLNGLHNVEFHSADLFAPAALDAGWWRGDFSHVLLDPPRAGARELLPRVAKLRPRRLAYVSCHPATLARDLGLLVHEHGFRLLAAGVADMFPHTAHIESIALLEPG
jgi:23S rRNA (uracil1939-C5)-methyltransferase